MRRFRTAAFASAIAAIVAGAGTVALAHGGVPAAIVSHRLVGPYSISVWTDADATDDGAAGGEFWVAVEAAAESTSIPASTRAMISVRPLDRTAPAVTARTEPVGAAVSPQFAALVLDHEGRYEVEVSVDGPLGPASVQAEIEATYELRPSPISALVYVVPFLLAGALWLKILVHRRAVSGV